MPRVKVRDSFQIFSEYQLAQGSFDNGSIEESKMIGFAGEGGPINQVGPLYYWAWAKSSGPARIQEHPHRGFEILTYVIEGQIEHQDNQNGTQVINSGDIQIMRTGSGLNHSETFGNNQVSKFQIWFDPNFKQAISTIPSYSFADSDSLPIIKRFSGVNEKIVLGPHSPVELKTQVFMSDNIIQKDSSLLHRIPSSMALIALIVDGSGKIEAQSHEKPFKSKDVLLFETTRDTWLDFKAEEDSRLLIMKLPQKPKYPLFPKPIPKTA